MTRNTAGAIMALQVSLLRQRRVRLFLSGFALSIFLLGKAVEIFAFFRNVDPKSDEIDVVYTWVNGSEEDFKRSISKYRHEYEHQVVAAEENRYHDNDEFKISLRSLEKNAPWVRKIFVVTNGQTPYWLNTNHPKINMVEHSEIFEDLTHLPTFSSPAIEVHLHKIAELSENFLYLNDDFILGSPITIDDFFTSDGRVKIHVNGEITKYKKQHSTGKVEAFGGGRIKEFVSAHRGDVYTGSLHFVSHLYKAVYNTDLTRKISHLPYMVNKSTMKELQRKFVRLFHSTSSHRFRQPDDMQFPLAYYGYIICQKELPHQVVDGDVGYFAVTNKFSQTDAAAAKEMLKDKKFICINDQLKYTGPNVQSALDLSRKLLYGLFPQPSSFEVDSLQNQ